VLERAKRVRCVGFETEESGVDNEVDAAVGLRDRLGDREREVALLLVRARIFRIVRSDCLSDGRDEVRRHVEAQVRVVLEQLHQTCRCSGKRILVEVISWERKRDVHSGGKAIDHARPFNAERSSTGRRDYPFARDAGALNREQQSAVTVRVASVAAVTSDHRGWFSGWRRADSRVLCRLLG